MIKRLSALWRIFVVVALVVLTHNTAYSNKVGDGGFTITFTPDGKVEELCSGVKSVARLVAQNNNDTGFSAALKGSGDALRNVSLSFDSYEDGVLVMSNREVEVKLRVKSVDEYITMHIIEVNESVEGSLMKLRFRAPQNEQVALFPLDWMSDYRVGNRAIEWAWIWGRNDKNPLGSFALTLFNNDKQHDETLIKIWVDEGLPHIKVDGEWTYERAEEHLKQWQEMFEDQSTMIVQPTDNADLYHLTDYAKRLGMKKIYLHTDTWRGEYWPINHSFLHLNEKIFPNGEEDFKRYGDYCREQGLNLAIHTICGSIGRRDPDYARDGFHEDLATWVRGSLEEQIDATTKVIKFRPEAGSVYPKIMGHGWRAPNTARQWMHTNVIQIGDELIRVGKFADTSKEVWTLQNCTRAHHATTAASHAARTPSRGLYASYGQSYVADADSELMDEVIERFMSFDNRNGVPIYLDHADRRATTPYEILLKPSQRAANGGVSINLMRPIPMFGLSTSVLDSYGLSEYVEESIGLWREVYQKITPQQSRAMLKDFIDYRSPLNSARNQRATDVLHRPERVDGKLQLTPLQLVAQPRSNICLSHAANLSR